MGIKEITRAFVKGASNRGVLQMILIFILAGAFAGMAKGMGAVDATVAATLGIIPSSMIYAGLFITACLISFSVGTSVGTIVAVVPIACGIASGMGDSVPFACGIVVGGAFFGDNLSFISDTTLAATKALGVKMRDKFAANFKVVLPAVAATLLIYILMGLSSKTEVPQMPPADVLLLIPYILVITLALCGISVNRILVIGIAACCLTAWADGQTDWQKLGLSAWKGIEGMRDVIIVALLAGGILNVFKALGWLRRFTLRMMERVSSKRGAMACIAATVSATNLLTANNTVAILSIGGLANDIAQEYDLDRKQTAGVLDIFSCLVQSLIPYGAQLLMAGSLSSVPSASIIPWLFYPMLMGVCAIISVARTK